VYNLLFNSHAKFHQNYAHTAETTTKVAGGYFLTRPVYIS